MNSFLVLYLFYLFHLVRDFNLKDEEAHMIKKIFFFRILLPDNLYTLTMCIQLVHVMLSKSYCLDPLLLSGENPLILLFFLWRVSFLNLNINNFRTAGTEEWAFSTFPSQFHGCLQWWAAKYLTEVNVAHLHH